MTGLMKALALDVSPHRKAGTLRHGARLPEIGSPYFIFYSPPHEPWRRTRLASVLSGMTLLDLREVNTEELTAAFHQRPNLQVGT